MLEENFSYTAIHTANVLSALNFQFELLDDQEDEWIFLGRFRTEIGPIRLILAVEKDESRWSLFAYHPLVVVQSLRKTATEFCMQCNQELIIGNLELNLTDGSLRYRQGLSFLGRSLTEVEIKEYINIALGTLTQYHVALIRILFDGIGIEEALQESKSEHSESF